MSTCTATLLVVVLDGLADGVVDDKPDIRLVNAHAKRHSGYYHLEDNTIITYNYSIYFSPFYLLFFLYKKAARLIFLNSRLSFQLHFVATRCSLRVNQLADQQLLINL